MKSVTSIVVATCAIAATGVHAGKCDEGLYVTTEKGDALLAEAACDEGDCEKVFKGRGSGVDKKAELKKEEVKCEGGKLKYDGKEYEALKDTDLLNDVLMECKGEEAKKERTVDGIDAKKMVLFFGPKTPNPTGKNWSFEAMAVGKKYAPAGVTEPQVLGNKDAEGKDAFEKLSNEAKIAFNGDGTLTVTPKTGNDHLKCTNAVVSSLRKAAGGGESFCMRKDFMLPNIAWIVIVIVVIALVVVVFMMGGSGGDDDDSDSDDDKDDEDS